MKHKLRAMTELEYCNRNRTGNLACCLECSLAYQIGFYFGSCKRLSPLYSTMSHTPYKTKDDKYIMIER